MNDLRRAWPQARVHLVAHSMGGLVCRAYVEGDDYAGGVDRLILIGTPNAGTGWSRARMLLEMQEHYTLWRHDPDWKASWMITDGLGEAGRDLRPGSTFLKALNARPRREGVRYTIIAGSQSPVARVAANCLSNTANSIGGPAARWAGLRQVKRGLGAAAESLRDRVTGGDGPVAVASTRLAGVDDFVLLQADHATLYFGNGRNPPAAWDTVRDRLAR
jgi:pimeloyl-ACP methyl ester carboxylesterase